MSAYTAGPWVVAGCEILGTPLHRPHASDVVGFVPATIVCEIKNDARGSYSYYPTDVARGNAALIKAAPDMYEALRLVLTMSECCQLFPWYGP